MNSLKDCVHRSFYLLTFFFFVTLAIDCPMGYYGDQCLQKCNPHCVAMRCHNETGACLGDCEDGWTGDSCDKECATGMWGYNCTKKCSDHCTKNLCHATNGSCTDGCKRGYLGNRCQRVCDKGYYGPGCSKRCSNNCKKWDCHPSNGHCLQGCKADFWGSDCSLFGNFREAPVETQEKFYTRLSAESKSVLLYVLMGEYENTLERAQEEISRGIRQRNELRRLIG